MRTLRFLSILLPLLVGAATPICSPAQASPDSFPQLQQIIQRQEAAWNRGDASAWSAVFSEDADFINIRGELYHGRSSITELHSRIFSAPFKGSHATLTIRRLAELAPGVALIETDNSVTNFGVLPPGVVPTSEGVLKTRMKYIAIRHGEEWLIITAQNTAILPALAPHG